MRSNKRSEVEDQGGGPQSSWMRESSIDRSSRKRRPTKGPLLTVTILIGLLTGTCQALDVHFEDPSTGFFLRESQPSSSSSSLLSSPGSLSSSEEDNFLDVFPTTSIVLGSSNGKGKDEKESSQDILHTESFTIVQSGRPVRIRAEYGPFEASQVVPTQYIVPDLSEGGPDNTYNNKADTDKVKDNAEVSATSSMPQRRPGLITDFKPHQLDLSAHVVNTEVPKDNPVLRVLFHLGHHHQRNSHESGAGTICVLLTASVVGKPFIGNLSNTISTTCSPDGREGTCLGQLTLPSSWWPSLAQTSSTDAKSTVKQPKVNVKASYSVHETRGPSCKVHQVARVPIVPETPLGAIPLTVPQLGYRQLAKDEIIHMLLPQPPLYPNSRFYVPVFIEQPHSERGPISALTIRCRTRSGLRLVGVEETSSSWTIRVDVNARGTSATVTAFKKTLQTTSNAKSSIHEEAFNNNNDAEGPLELFNWLVSIDDRDYDVWDKVKITWHVKYQRAAGHSDEEVVDNVEEDKAERLLLGEDTEDHLTLADQPAKVPEESLSLDHHFDRNKDSYRLRARLSVQKDDVQTVLPIVKHSEVMNLAALTGRQVSRPLKVFIVSQAGEIADVTLRSSCSSQDQSVLKVSTSCTSVYVDGSETRGALAAQIDVKYGAYIGKASFTVWMAETPLSIDLADSRLSQIKGWKVPLKRSDEAEDKSRHQANETLSGAGAPGISNVCSPKYQQTTVQVFAKFLAQDPDSGRREYFPSRSTQLDVTELVIGHGLRIEDARIATLQGNVIQGLSPGRTEVQVVSPISGHKIGMQEVKVAKNRETIRGMTVRVLTGLRLNVHADQFGERGRYSLQTAYSQMLTSKYQEGLLDIDLHLSDDTVTPLREVNPRDYYLAVKSLEPRIIALAPSRDARYPRVIAVGSGRGKLLRVSLELVDECMQPKSSNVALAVQLADVMVALRNKKASAIEPTVDDWKMSKGRTERTSSVDMGDLGDILSNIALRDDHSYYKSHKAAVSMQRPVQRQTSFTTVAHLTPLEIGMYILLAVFCAAMAVFMASCFVYASKYKRQEYPIHKSLSASLSQHIMPEKRGKPVQNAHDWVWLGKSTIDKAATSNSVHTSGSRQTLEDDGNTNKRSHQRLSYVGSEINIIPNPHTEEYEPSVSQPHTPPAPVPAEKEEKEPLMVMMQRQKQEQQYNRQLRPSGHPASGRSPFRIGSARHSPYQRHHHHRSQNVSRLPPTYENLSPKRGHRMQLQIRPNKIQSNPELQYSPTVISNPMHQTPITTPTRQQQQRAGSCSSSSSSRMPVNTATYTKKASVVDYNKASQEDQILPVGYPMVFPTPAQKAACLSPLDLLPDPTGLEMMNMASPVGPPPRQSPASALPPMDMLETVEPEDLESPRGEYEPLNPDIDRPSPPRTGAPRLFENPFDLSDEESAPVEPEKLSPSHVFESTSLEESLLYRQNVEENERPTTTRGVLDSRTFVIKRSPTSSSNGSSRKTSPSSEGPAALATSPIEDIKLGEDAISLLSETNEDLQTEDLNEEEVSVAMGMDYDNLMAYFENLKESTA